MEEIKLRRLTLFILEIILLQHGRYISESFIAQINDFIYQYYDENKELFGLMFDTVLLEKMMKNKWEVLPHEALIKLINEHHGLDGYVDLVDSVGYEVDQKLNILVIKFLEYYDELLMLRFARPSTHPRILQ